MRFRMSASSLGVILLGAGSASAGDSPDKKRDKTPKMAAWGTFGCADHGL
jgi:hypothetical protein